MQLIKDTYVKDCTYSITDANDMVYNECENVSLAKDSSLFAMVDPSILDLAGCDSYVASELYVNQCAFDGKELPIDGTIDLTQDEIPTVLVTKIGGKEIASSWFMDKLLYIVLIIAIIVIAYFVFAPHKPMLRGRKETPKAPEKYTSKRENRYGRKL